MIKGRFFKKTSKNAIKILLAALSICLCFCIGFGAAMQSRLIKGHGEGSVPTMDFTWENGLSQKLDNYGSRFNAKRGQTYGSDTILNKADGGIPNALLAGNGSVGLVKGGSASGQSIAVGMNDYWKGQYNPSRVDGLAPQAVGELGYEILDDQNTAKTDVDLATTYKKVTASNEEEDFPAEAAVSGDYVSSAFWGMGWWSQRGKGANSWLQLEFDAPVTFSRYVLWNDGSCRYDADLNVEDEGRKNAWDKANTHAFKVQVSNDGSTWTDVDSETDNLLPVYDKDLSAPATGKFVRLFINKSVVSGTEQAKVCKFSLFENTKNDKNLMPTIMNGVKSGAKIEVTSSNVPDAGQDAPHIYAASNVYATACGTPLHLSAYGSSGVGWFTDTSPSGDKITYTFNEPTTFKSYQLFNGSASAVNSYLRADWTGWTLEVSKNRGASWETVHVITKNDKDLLIRGGQPAISSFNIPADKLEATKRATNIRFTIDSIPEYASRTLLSQVKLYADTLENSGIDQTLDATFVQNIKEGKVGAEATFAGRTYETQTTISQDGNNYVVTKFKNKTNEPMGMRFYTRAHHYRNPEYTQTAGASADVIYSTRTTETASPENLAWVSAATIASKIQGAKWTNFGKTKTQAYGDLVIPANGEINVITYIDGKQYTAENYPEYHKITAENSPSKDKAIAKLNDATVTADKVFAETANYWKNFWLQSYIDIYDKDVEEYYYTSFYIVASASREGAAPASLFGPFMTSDTLAWGGTYVTDYNLYGTYMAVAAANREELLKPLVVNAMESWGGIDGVGNGIGKDYAERFNGATGNNFRNADGSLMFKNGVDGVLHAVVAGPHGYAVNMPGFYQILFTSAYAALPVLSYYDMTQGTGEVVDGVTLTAELEYDYLKDIMSLWEQILIYENGVYKVKFDAAWENERNNMGNAFTIACMHMFTQRLVERAAELGITEEDEPRLLKWQHIDQNMEAYPTTTIMKKGVERLCYSDTLSSANQKRVTYNGKTDGGSNPNVVVAQVIPTDQLGLYSDPKEKEIMRNSIYTIESWSNINAMPTFFSAAARTGYKSTKYGNDNGSDLFDSNVSDLMGQLKKVSASGIRFNNVSKLVDPLQLIDTCGGAQGVNDMLVQNYKGIVTFFPAYSQFHSGKFVNFQSKGGFMVSGEQDAKGNVTFAKVESQFGGKITFAMPEGADWNIVDGDGKAVTVTRSTVGDIVGYDAYNGINAVTFETEAGKSYYAVDRVTGAADALAARALTPVAALPVKED